MATQSKPSVKQQVKDFQEQVLSLLAEKPMSTSDIMLATGARQGTIRSALTALICSHQVEGSCGKPVMYKRIVNKDALCANVNRGSANHYTGDRPPYFRPGSYSPPATPRVPMFTASIPDEMLADFDLPVLF